MLHYKVVIALVLFLFLTSETALARRHHGRRFSGPTPTHPVVLWARTLTDSPDPEAKRVAAFKLSQYSQTIFQAEAVKAITACAKGYEFQLRVLCTKALGRAGNQSQNDFVRTTLFEVFDGEPKLKSTVVRALTTRKDANPMVSDKLLAFVKETRDGDEQVTALAYFEMVGSASSKFISTMAEVFQKSEHSKVRRAVAKALAEQGRGQDPVIELLAQCGGNKDDTPLILICLGGLQLQGKTDARTWGTVEKALESTDPDVQLAVVDLIIALPDAPNAKVAERLLSLVDEVDDDDLQEKMVLSLGVVGDGSDKIVEALVRVLGNAEDSEGARIAAALTIAKQSTNAEKSKEALTRCVAEEKSDTLKSACQLAATEISTKNRAVASPKKS
ncbi:MAG: hypothetical protein HYR96_15055 [Deltaproteobacteria bacterium]|nr:hypothetical protein [Deltaproteobacteria bacterium]MBI3293703.1 hypothetical protein [Deltaproteobacteria bacterium]